MHPVVFDQLSRFALALALVLALALPRGARAEAARWVVAPANSAAYFTVKHLMITPVRGTFWDVRGEVWIDDADPSRSRVEVRIATRQLCSGNAGREARVGEKPFLWSARFPSITFRSTKVEQAQSGRLVLTGDLSIRGITRTVVLEADGPTAAVTGDDGVPTRALVARTRIDRKDFGITWNEPLEGGGMMLGDEVALEIVLEVVQPKRAAKRDRP